MTMKEIHVMLKPQILLITSTSAAAERKTHGEKNGENIILPIEKLRYLEEDYL